MSTRQTCHVTEEGGKGSRGGRRTGHDGQTRPRAVVVVATLRSRIRSMERENATLRQGITQRDKRIAALEERMRGPERSAQTDSRTRASRRRPSPVVLPSASVL